MNKDTIPTKFDSEGKDGDADGKPLVCHPPASPLEKKSTIPGAGTILLSVEDEEPLTIDELVPRYGHPVIWHGVDLTEAANQYLYEVRGLGKPLKDAVIPDLQPASNRFLEADLVLKIRILIDHDRKAHVRAGLSRFDDYFRSCTQSTLVHSSIHRWLIEAKTALLFAAQGAIDLMPSQAACEQLSILPRNHWLPAWREISPKGGIVGKHKLSEHIALYASRNGIPIRGHRMDLPAAPKPSPPEKLPDHVLAPVKLLDHPLAIVSSDRPLPWKQIKAAVDRLVKYMPEAKIRNHHLEMFTQIYESDEERGDLLIEVMIFEFIAKLLATQTPSTPDTV